MTTSTSASTPAALAPQTSTPPTKSAKSVSTPKAAPTVAAKAVKVAPKPAAKKTSAAKKTAVAKTVKAAAPVVAKDVKVKKPKLVRDSFTIPKDEYAVIEALKQRASTLAHPVKKSELLRAGLKLLATLPDSGLRTALQAVPSIKTGRPKADAAETPKAPSTKTPAKSARK
ncbi:MAG: hypothetical protein ACK41V_04605 [Acidovorax sp.]|uniref:hypothetical protein n=1 Tax=Acidovorax sp. TaxID=1872122 RepID=UPI00391BC063